MAGELHKLSARFVQTCTKPGRHSDGGGLYLSIDPNGRRRWVLLYRYGGKRKEMGLGPAPTPDSRTDCVTLADARGKAEAARALLRSGTDPLEAKRKTDVPSFGEMCDRYIAAHEAAWKNPKHVRQWRQTLSMLRDDAGKLTNDGYCVKLRDRRVDAINVDDVLKTLKPIWTSKPETASRLRGRIEAVLDAAKVAGFRDGENPAQWRGHLALILPPPTKLKRGHHSAMGYGDVPSFVQRLRLVRGTGAFALEYLILTAARSGEVRGARWREINMKAKTWTVPAERMKAGEPHTVPLTDRAIAILESVALLRREADGDDALIFPGTNGALSDMTLTAAMRRLGVGEYTVHGFRSSFRDWAGDCTHFPREICEQALAHTIGNKAEVAYRRGTALERRRELMTAWGKYLEKKPANVVTLKKA
jgi:integrase